MITDRNQRARDYNLNKARETLKSEYQPTYQERTNQQNPSPGLPEASRLLETPKPDANLQALAQARVETILDAIQTGRIGVDLERINQQLNLGVSAEQIEQLKGRIQGRPTLEISQALCRTLTLEDYQALEAALTDRLRRLKCVRRRPVAEVADTQDAIIAARAKIHALQAMAPAVDPDSDNYKLGYLLGSMEPDEMPDKL